MTTTRLSPLSPISLLGTELGSFMGGDQSNFFVPTCNELVFFFLFFFQSLVLKYNKELSLKLCHILQTHIGSKT
jgi:hypothetical protein